MVLHQERRQGTGADGMILAPGFVATATSASPTKQLPVLILYSKNTGYITPPSKSETIDRNRAILGTGKSYIKTLIALCMRMFLELLL